MRVSHPSFSRTGYLAQDSCAFTLPEFLTSMAIILLVIAGVLSSHIYGLRLYEFTRAKLGASDEARQAISKMMTEIREAKLLRIGTGNLTSFTEVGLDTPQVGNAIQIYPTVSTNGFVRYFWDASDSRLKRTTNGASYMAVVANSVSNQLVFTAEDAFGKVLTNNENNRVVGVTLQFYQLEYPSTKIGKGGLYDFYQLRTKITRRTLE